jgi:hypothetical protein
MAVQIIRAEHLGPIIRAGQAAGIAGLATCAEHRNEKLGGMLDTTARPGLVLPAAAGRIESAAR